jgi:hypothetical protein
MHAKRSAVLAIAAWLFILAISNGTWHCSFVVAQELEYPKLKLSDWPWWRGPKLDGSAVSDKSGPLRWDTKENLKWSTNLPGRGHGSPTIVGDSIYLVTCDESSGSQGVIALDRETGKVKWEKVLFPKGAMLKNAKSSGASTTLACDGDHLFGTFANGGAAYLLALDVKGSLLWQEKICDYQIHQGYAASPALHGVYVYVVADTKGNGAVAAYDRKTGKLIWKKSRPSNPNYSSPIILEVAGKKQLILTGCDLVSSLNPLTGEVLWEMEGATTECVTTTVTDGMHVYSSGGYPKNHMAAIKADGSKKIAWENAERVYVPSMLIRDGYLYGVLDAGIAGCWKADTGKEMWKGRLGGDVSGSPVLVGDRIYSVNEAGEWFAFAANPSQFKILDKGKVSDEMFATPVVCDGCVYLRVASLEGEIRKEKLICLIEKKIK